jgi:hypothetical protein
MSNQSQQLNENCEDRKKKINDKSSHIDLGNSYDEIDKFTSIFTEQ